MKKNNIYIFIILFVFTLNLSQGFSQIVESDSSFWDASLPELESYKVYYLKKLENLQEEKRILIERGIEDGERILQRNPDRDILDDILIRLADLYYFKEKDTYLDKMERYNNAFDRSMEDTSVQVPPEPMLEFSHTFSLYERIINEFPESDKVDDAVYNIGFLYEEKGNADRAHQYYMHLIDKYPGSDYITEAYMRLGEYFFNPPRNNISRSIEYYKKVLKDRQSSHFNEALYKLGWSYYRLNKYPEAISFFTSLVQNIEKSRKSMRRQEGKSVDLYDEALEYIAVCFMDFGELDEILDYLDKINHPSWGEQILNEFGDIHFQKREEYDKAIKTYNALIDYNPLSPNAPVVQKRIVNCYIALEDERQVYLSRKKLFDLYNIDSEWWDKTEDLDYIEKAYNLIEEALRNNFNYLLQKAEERESTEIYQTVINLGTKYLENFSEHINAYMIRWNIALVLDIRLHNYEEALKEYMTISMVYDAPRYKEYARKKGLSTIKDAAKNAVVVADSLVQEEKRQREIDVINTSYASETPLNHSEELLVMACDNYIKLFPFDENTPTVLANVGALFYLHKQYAQAIKYYKTLTKYFPESDQIYEVQLSITKSYLGKKDYRSAEALASRLLDRQLPQNIKQKVRELYGQAIFLHAQQLANSGNSSKAAAEYFRMAMEIPLLDFADRALFNSAREFEKINNIERAIRSYNQLILSYGSSSLYIDALNNLAYDYSEVQEFGKSAEKYEELSEILSDSSEAKDAFYNAHMYYVKSENWDKAVETGEKWINKYFNAKETSTIYFELGDYYHKLAEDERAIQIYQNYPNIFPESVLSVDAYFKLGELYSDRGYSNQAEKAFYHAHMKNEELKAKGYDTHDYYAAEALFKASTYMHNRYENISIKFSYYNSNSNLKRKQMLLDSLSSRYQEVVKYKSDRLPEVLYRMGEVYEQFSLALKDQELPAMPVDKKAVEKNDILFQCETAYNQAFNKYSKALPVLRKIESHVDSQDTGDTEVSYPDTVNWLSRIENKISEMLYHKADINKEAIDNLLGVPVPSELEGLEKLEYKKQLLLTTIRPLVEKTIKSHKRNIFISDSIDVMNAWIDSSKNKIMSLIDFLPQKFINLAYEGLEEFDKAAQTFRSSYLLAEKPPEIEQINNLVNLIESSELYAQLVVTLYANRMESINDYSYITLKDIPLQNRMVDFGLCISDTIDNYITAAEKNKQEADQLFNNTNDFIYESCLTAFEDHMYFLEKFEINVLESIYKSLVDNENKPDNFYKIIIKLIQRDPQGDRRELEIPLANLHSPPDTTWKVSHIFSEGWEQPDFNDERWIYLKNNKTVKGNTPDDSPDSSDLTDNFSYLRTSLQIPGFPIYAYIQMDFQNILEVYINGNRINNEKQTNRKIITSHLKQNTNIIAIKVVKNIKFKLEDLIKISYIRRSDLFADRKVGNEQIK